MADQEQGQGSAGSFFAGILIGGLTGAVAAMLLAPRSGQETRDLIQNKGIELRDEATDTTESMVEQVRRKGRQISTDISEKVEVLKQRGEKLIEEKLDDLYNALPNEKTEVSGS
jgi:gas vesicle protein